jgi:hypothetical protein
MMTDAELLTLRGVLVLQRRALLDNLCAAASEERLVEAGSLGLLAHVQTAIATVDAVLAEPVTTERGAS